MTLKLEVADMPPPVAVIVAVEDTGAGVELLELPPQPEIMPKPAKMTTNKRSSCSRFRFLKPMKQRAMAKVTGKNGLKSWCTRAAVAGGVMVSVVVAEAPPGRPVVLLGANAAMVAGLKAQV